MSKKTISTPTRIAVAAGLTVRFSVPGPLTPAPANVTMSAAPSTAPPAAPGAPVVAASAPAVQGAQAAAMPAGGGGNDMFADRYKLTGLEAHSKGDNRKATVEPGEA